MLSYCEYNNVGARRWMHSVVVKVSQTYFCQLCPPCLLASLPLLAGDLTWLPGVRHDYDIYPLTTRQPLTTVAPVAAWFVLKSSLWITLLSTHSES